MRMMMMRRQMMQRFVWVDSQRRVRDSDHTELSVQDMPYASYNCHSMNYPFLSILTLLLLMNVSEDGVKEMQIANGRCEECDKRKFQLLMQMRMRQRVANRIASGCESK
jgi:hypothetical protein